MRRQFHSLRFLAVRAKKRAAPGLPDAFDGGPTVQTGFSGTIINAQPLLIKALATIRKIKKRVRFSAHRFQWNRAPISDGLVQNLPDGAEKLLYLCGGQPIGRQFWRNAGAEEHFTGVDIADAGDDGLV